MPLGIAAFTRAVTKRARRGLFAGKKVLSGNNISEDGGNRTRRTWKPNSQQVALYSEILGRRIRCNVTTSALRNIDKAGGLDSYILTTNDKKLDSDLATQLKMEMMERMLAKQHSQQRRQAAAVTGMSPAAAQLAAGAGAPEEPAPSPPAS